MSYTNDPFEGHGGSYIVDSRGNRQPNSDVVAPEQGNAVATPEALPEAPADSKPQDAKA